MMRSIITEPLLSDVNAAIANGQPDAQFDVIVVLNELYWKGMEAAEKEIAQLSADWKVPYKTTSHYCFARLTAKLILDLANFTIRQQTEHPNGNLVHRIWEDSDVKVTLTRSLITIKADAAQRSFRADGHGITWAVLDSGVNHDHPSFAPKTTPWGPMDPLKIQSPLQHLDFTPASTDAQNPAPPLLSALTDELGHGSHVAGTISGFWQATDPNGDWVVGTEIRDPGNEKSSITQRASATLISGVAPLCKIVSLKVVADRRTPGINQLPGQGKVSWVLSAIDQIQQWNQYGKRLLIHGVNMSLGYEFDPTWFACGQSPLCVEVNRLVKCGVSVVVSAGNSGYVDKRYSDISINDPGNADLAITVGSTHKELPHLYGVSYFSSRGPTGDGRMKPDLLAPGERVISCASGDEARKYPDAFVDGAGQQQNSKVLFCEMTGTSMAAPHVSGAIAAFLSVRADYVGRPEAVKEVLMQNTIDLKRERHFQGAGLLDLMKVLQAV